MKNKSEVFVGIVLFNFISVLIMSLIIIYIEMEILSTLTGLMVTMIVNSLVVFPIELFMWNISIKCRDKVNLNKFWIGNIVGLFLVSIIGLIISSFFYLGWGMVFFAQAISFIVPQKLLIDIIMTVIVIKKQKLIINRV